MKLTFNGVVKNIETKTSKKGNDYKLITLVELGNMYEYLSTMIDKDAELNGSRASDEALAEIFDTEVEVSLDYNARYKSFKVVAINTK